MPVWLRIVWARRSASTTASTVSPTASRPRSVPRWTISPPTGFCVSSTSNSSLPPPGLAKHAAGRRPGRRPPRRTASGRARSRRAPLPGQLVVLHAVAEDRDDPAVGGRRLVAEERRCRRHGPGSRRRATVSSACLRELGLLAGAAPLALLGEGGLEARAIDARPRTRRRARRSGRSGSRTCRAAGRRRRRGAPARRRQVLRPSADDRSASVSGEAPPRAAPCPASSVRANCASSRAIVDEDLVALLDEMRDTPRP